MATLDIVDEHSRNSKERWEGMPMNKLLTWIRQMDVRITNWMAQYSITLMRISLGIVFFWFGVLKFFPGLSPAQDLAANTIAKLSFGFVQPNLSLPVLATWECLIGLGLISKRF